MTCDWISLYAVGLKAHGKFDGEASLPWPSLRRLKLVKLFVNYRDQLSMRRRMENYCAQLHIVALPLVKCTFQMFWCCSVPSEQFFNGGHRQKQAERVVHKL